MEATDATGHEIPANIADLNLDPYLCVADSRQRLISVFDDIRYDRADLDMLSGPMRARVLQRLKPMGFKQISGGVIENRADDIRMLLPKFRALGASPFHATDDTPRRAQDYFVLTPTQTACHIINAYGTEAAVDLIKTLIVKQPINLLRIADFLDGTAAHSSFAKAIGHLKLVQREAIESEPLRSRRALR